MTLLMGTNHLFKGTRLSSPGVRVQLKQHEALATLQRAELLELILRALQPGSVYLPLLQQRCQHLDGKSWMQFNSLVLGRYLIAAVSGPLVRTQQLILPFTSCSEPRPVKPMLTGCAAWHAGLRLATCQMWCCFSALQLLAYLAPPSSPDQG